MSVARTWHATYLSTRSRVLKHDRPDDGHDSYTATYLSTRSRVLKRATQAEHGDDPPQATYLSTRSRVLKQVVKTVCNTCCIGYISFDSLQSTETSLNLHTCSGTVGYISFDSLQSTETDSVQVLFNNGSAATYLSTRSRVLKRICS